MRAKDHVICLSWVSALVTGVARAAVMAVLSFGPVAVTLAVICMVTVPDSKSSRLAACVRSHVTLAPALMAALRSQLLVLAELVRLMADKLTVPVLCMVRAPVHSSRPPARSRGGRGKSTSFPTGEEGGNLKCC